MSGFLTPFPELSASEEAFLREYLSCVSDFIS